MLKIAYSWLLNAQIACTASWISTWKLYFSSAVAAWLRSRRSRHGAGLGTLTSRRRGMLVGTVNVLTQEAIKVLAVLFVSEGKIDIVVSYTFCIQKFNTRQLFRPFGNSSVASIIRSRFVFLYALIWFPSQATKNEQGLLQIINLDCLYPFVG